MGARFRCLRAPVWRTVFAQWTGAASSVTVASFRSAAVKRISAFSPLELDATRDGAGWRTSLIGAMDGAAFSIPLSLGCVTLLYSHIGPGFLASGVFATLLALTWIHATTLRSARPIIYSARIFEATTLAAMLDQAVIQFPAWGVADSVGARLAFLCMVGAASGLCVGILYLLRADRFARFIPAPVFAGFANSIALALLISQSRALWNLVSAPDSLWQVATITVISLATGIGVRTYRPQWPSASIALGAGLLVGVLWHLIGRNTPMIGSDGWTMTLPVFHADFSALSGSDVRTWSLALAIVGDAAILGIMIFLNTTLAGQVMSRADSRINKSPRDAMGGIAGIFLAGAIGSSPMSGSEHSCSAASRRTPLSPLILGFVALVCALVYLSGVLGWVPLAAVAGTLLAEAWLMVNRPSVRLLVDWLTRKTMASNAREDLALIGAVTACAVLVNMVAAVFVGLLLGLVLFAARNARRPVRYVWSGRELSSNCARSRADMDLLAQHGASVRVFELEGDLFFGAADSLERTLWKHSEDAASVILDWSRVRHVDTSVSLSVAQYERKVREMGVAPIHGGVSPRSAIAPVLMQQLPNARFMPDLDRALEQAENDLIEAYRKVDPREPTSLLEASALLTGLDDAERSHLDSLMLQKLYRAGEAIIKSGEPGDELMLVLHGSASVIVSGPDGESVRIAGVRRGATIGDIAFLDHALRSATVIADEDTTVAILRRGDYDMLCLSHPRLVQQLLANLALTMAARLRHTNRLAQARFASR
jgi:sulfate permease, SulP family